MAHDARTRWWQPGRREQLQAEAAADKALSQHAGAQADELARHAAELQRQLGGPTHWRQARQHLERAEASYERDRQQAHQADQHDLTRHRDRVTSQEPAAVDAGTRHTELLAEQQLRTQAIEQQQPPNKPPSNASSINPSTTTSTTTSTRAGPASISDVGL